MAVDNFDVVRLAAAPSKADSPLPIDADTVLAITGSSELLESVAGRSSKILNRGGRIEDSKLSERGPLYIRPELLDGFPLEQALGLSIREAPDHDP